MKLRINVGRPLIFTVFSFFLLTVSTLPSYASDVTIIDSDHYSKVFGETRNFRIFLPPSYDDNSQKKGYPVIYFYHGWSQRYFGSSDPYGDFDKGDENQGDNIANFVEAHDVIVVKPDGYNRRQDEDYYVRPYNIGPVETYRQFPLYFPELVEHIDSRFRTIADRAHRAISGLSMGGFMTFWIAGKYPHLVSAAGNFCGSPEFVVGPKDFPVEYRHLDMYNNYAGMNLRLHYGDKDFIRGYHEDLNGVWPQVIDNYTWKTYDAAHSTCGLADMFDFILETFENPIARPLQWHHIDVYPNFSVWDYQVNTNRKMSGYTILEDVDNKGFKCSVRESLPDGEVLSFVNVSVTTAPLYEKNEIYHVNYINSTSLKTQQREIQSDDHGRLTISLTGSSHDIGINKKADDPNLRIASTKLENVNWAVPKKDIELSITLLNKGQSPGLNVTATLEETRSNVEVKQDKAGFGAMAINEIKEGQKPYVFQVLSDSIKIVKLKLTIRDGHQNEWIDFIEIPIKTNSAEIKEFAIADGKVFTVAKGGDETETKVYGNGNGDGIANPGESIIVLVKDQQKYWRTDLTYTDPHINPFGINNRMSDYWGRYDHVGGSAKYDIVLISSACPENHTIDFLAEYWLPDNPLHIIKQGVIKIEVKGEDATPPQIAWVRIAGNNTIQVKVYDGSEIDSLKAKLHLSENPSESFEIDLAQSKEGGVMADSETVFTKEIPYQNFGIYVVTIIATDSFGNQIIKEINEKFVIH